MSGVMDPFDRRNRAAKIIETIAAEARDGGIAHPEADVSMQAAQVQALLYVGDQLAEVVQMLRPLGAGRRPL